jgi:hypothetical protein
MLRIGEPRKVSQNVAVVRPEVFFGNIDEDDAPFHPHLGTASQALPFMRLQQLVMIVVARVEEPTYLRDVGWIELQVDRFKPPWVLAPAP